MFDMFSETFGPKLVSVSGIGLSLLVAAFLGSLSSVFSTRLRPQSSSSAPLKDFSRSIAPDGRVTFKAEDGRRLDLLGFSSRETCTQEKKYFLENLRTDENTLTVVGGTLEEILRAHITATLISPSAAGLLLNSIKNFFLYDYLRPGLRNYQKIHDQELRRTKVQICIYVPEMNVNGFSCFMKVFSLAQLSQLGFSAIQTMLNEKLAEKVAPGTHLEASSFFLHSERPSSIEAESELTSTTELQRLLVKQLKPWAHARSEDQLPMMSLSFSATNDSIGAREKLTKKHIIDCRNLDNQERLLKYVAETTESALGRTIEAPCVILRTEPEFRFLQTELERDNTFSLSVALRILRRLPNMLRTVTWLFDNFRALMVHQSQSTQRIRGLEIMVDELRAENSSLDEMICRLTQRIDALDLDRRSEGAADLTTERSPEGPGAEKLAVNQNSLNISSLSGTAPLMQETAPVQSESETTKSVDETCRGEGIDCVGTQLPPRPFTPSRKLWVPRSNSSAHSFRSFTSASSAQSGYFIYKNPALVDLEPWLLKQQLRLLLSVIPVDSLVDTAKFLLGLRETLKPNDHKGRFSNFTNVIETLNIDRCHPLEVHTLNRELLVHSVCLRDSIVDFLIELPHEGATLEFEALEKAYDAAKHTLSTHNEALRSDPERETTGEALGLVPIHRMSEGSTHSNVSLARQYAALRFSQAYVPWSPPHAVKSSDNRFSMNSTVSAEGDSSLAEIFQADWAQPKKSRDADTEP